MFEKIAVTFSGRDLQAAASLPPLDFTHVKWVETLLSENPAVIPGVVLGKLPDGDVSVEWQAVFQGAGVGYLRQCGATVAVSLFLGGQFVTSENAAIDAVQQIHASGKHRGPGFDLVRKRQARPLRAVVFLVENPSPELRACILYWTDCIAKAYFSSDKMRLNADGSRDADGLSAAIV